MKTLKRGSIGPEVELLQSTLKSIRLFQPEVLMGFLVVLLTMLFQIFKKTLVQFKMELFGPSTWDALFPYMYGYTSYVIKSGDTLYKIATFFSTTVSRILVANPGVSPNNLIPRHKHYSAFWQCSSD